VRDILDLSIGRVGL